MHDDEAAVAALEQHVNPADTPAQGTEAKPAEAPAEAKPAETPQAPAQGEEAQAAAPAAPVEEGAPAPAAEEDSEEVDWTQFLPQPTEVKPPEPDEKGQVDVQQLIDYQLNQKLAQQANELRGWQAATKVLPDIAKNPQLREFVHNQRLASVATGGNGDLAEAAKTVKSILGAATAEGKAQGTASVTVQKAAALDTSGTTTTPPDQSKQDLANRINQGDPAAVQELLADWIDQGDI